jgi:hypothetical protein
LPPNQFVAKWFGVKALWWRFPIAEPPYSGTPLDDDFPDYVTHWTMSVVPSDPRIAQ